VKDSLVCESNTTSTSDVIHHPDYCQQNHRNRPWRSSTSPKH